MFFKVLTFFNQIKLMQSSTGDSNFNLTPYKMPILEIEAE